MGGTGSGRRRSEGRRKTTEEVPELDVRRLKRTGVIVSGQEWLGGGPRGLPWIGLEWTPCNYGGSRPWFMCPGEGCGRRVAILYGPTLPLLCRLCRNLVYESQRRATRKD